VITKSDAATQRVALNQAQSSFTDSRINELLLPDNVLEKTTTGTKSLDILDKQGRPDRLRLPLYDVLLEDAEAVWALLIGYLLHESIGASQAALFIVIAMVYVTLARGRLLGSSVRVHERQYPRGRVAIAGYAGAATLRRATERRRCHRGFD